MAESARDVEPPSRMNFFASLLFKLYAIKRSFIRRAVRRLLRRAEGGNLYSPTLRKIFKEYHGVDIGLYMSSSSCFEPGTIDKHTTIGRYCSIADGVRVMNRNHPMERRSTHGFFFNPRLGFASTDTIEYIPLDIGNDVWIGSNALIMPHVRSIGTGAVIAAGAVVAKDVPPYGVVVGNPARVVRFRFPQEVIVELLDSRWWEKSIEELNMKEFVSPLVAPGSESDADLPLPDRSS